MGLTSKSKAQSLVFEVVNLLLVFLGAGGGALQFHHNKLLHHFRSVRGLQFEKFFLIFNLGRAPVFFVFFL